jgi:ParB-like chromosome segregation protein Spo0J
MTKKKQVKKPSAPAGGSRPAQTKGESKQAAKPKDGQKLVNISEKDRGVVFRMDPTELVIVGLDTEHGENDHVLSDRDRLKDPVSPALVDSVYDRGVLSDITVRMVSGVPEVVDGRQRVRATREVNKLRQSEGLKPIRVPVVFKELDDVSAFREMIILNEHRKDDPPIYRVRKALKLLSLGETREQVSRTFGVTVPAVAGWEKVADLHHEVIDAVEKEKVNLTVAIELAKFPRDEQVAAMRKAIEVGASASAVREEVRRRHRQQAAGNSNGSEDDGDGDGEGKARGGTIRPSPSRLSTKVLRQLVKARDEGEVDFDVTAFTTFQFVLGQAPAKKIRGLTDALRHVGAEDAA